MTDQSLKGIPRQGLFSNQRLLCPLKGLKIFFTTQNSAFFTVILTGLAIGLGWWLEISREDWRWVVISLGVVWGAELLNTGVEFACNSVTLDKRLFIEIAKDTGAAAVFICDIALIIIIILTYHPYLVKKFPAVF